MLNSSPKELAKVIVDNNIGGVICDFSPLRHPTKLKQQLLEHLPKDIPLVQVSRYFHVVWVNLKDDQEFFGLFFII